MWTKTSKDGGASSLPGFQTLKRYVESRALSLETGDHKKETRYVEFIGFIILSTDRTSQRLVKRVAVL